MGLLDAATLFAGLADLRLEIAVALCVAFVLSLDLVEYFLVGVLASYVGGVGGDELDDPG
ncbi:MAG: hypothetical protein Q4P71_02730 [Actinomycetaceae bacterium]|nr:hypothetical protein [Actinomycetaceae bacterium]